MKNVHLLPTDKPSRLFLNKVNNKLLIDNDCTLKEVLPSGLYQNIYITSDEEIKKGDWHFKNDKMVTKSHIIDDTCKKIILTNNPDLIADGVQSIDNEFLEWFVKNPSCESIKVVHKFDEDWSEESGAFEISYYKIIIPKEEPNKTHYLDELPNMDKKVLAKMWESAMPKLEPKQETLEEVIKTYCKNKYGEGYYPDVEKSIEFGAKWQSERMYSEEEVIELLRKYRYDLSSGKTPNIGDTTKCWFEKFKKK